ncbi:beta-ketothiolase BktB [Ralstonia syzygii subsp. celebesensis]|uniref:Acetyl-CoA C-acyltransferase n=3 Tax=Ralstonia solanacearum species complex TaxID=3116862 RepID=A0AAD0S8T6_RALSL|nr:MULTISPECIES: beta-ketothiolase BktB [Ralstonia solanacearum species complex]CCA79965.1 acetyl-CoA acetyltransferase, thiolase-like [blood disease bacterium R229]AQW29577.1 acetyl-CoA acetyltransferase [blood disease bacterium A2-HR MARDI]AXV81460.1 acetyl-CoA C-acyltransferase [Ralstonia solanacearum]AXW52599.1 acetyl-CoA C-acyltransferase [Ralstonia solanacearum]QQV56553.1 acetyl-CoA C-acyltransferase family protein [Ralstonia syzygii subsp. celebesensis]
MAREVVVVSGVRTAIGTFGGSLKDVAPCELGALVVREALARAQVKGEEVGHVVFGHVINTEPRDMYLSRVAALDGGVPAETPAFNVNRLCGSGLQAVVSAAQTILLGDVDVAIGGGAESMSRAPYLAPAARWGSRMGDAKLVDMMLGALHDPFHAIHMGVTAENVAREYGISRELQDQTALESHRRASRAIQAGYFKEQIVPVTIKSRKGDVQFDTDEHVRHDVTIEDMTRLKPVFAKENGTVTAGNASGLNDAAAALVLMERSLAEKRGLKPLARLVSYGHAGVDPNMMGIGPVPATRKALERAGLSVNDLDVVEANEAFAAQACAVTQQLGLDPAKVNPNGSGISLGHPIGATGALITVKALHELQRIGGRYALVTMCIGGGQGIAAVFERL